MKFVCCSYTVIGEILKDWMPLWHVVRAYLNLSELWGSAKHQSHWFSSVGSVSLANTPPTEASPDSVEKKRHGR